MVASIRYYGMCLYEESVGREKDEVGRGAKVGQIESEISLGQRVAFLEIPRYPRNSEPSINPR
jgi:hypothetical protein